MPLKPWYKVVEPREDLRDNRPLDAAEFAVHLDQVRLQTAPDDYKNPERFFDRTFLTTNLKGLAAEVIRRLSGEKTETSAVFNMATQFGGGKTHALTLLYHLANNGKTAEKWQGVQHILDQSGMRTVPKADIAVFVGTEFDSISGRGGSREPLRKTPWGEIAFQLGGTDGFEIVSEHDKKGIAPAGDVIRKFLHKKTPSLILMDELMNYVSRNRKSGLAAQLYNFVQNLSEEARSRDNCVVAVSVPASEVEMNPEDHMDYDRLKKMLDRLGKPVLIAAESETSEIVRRRLFEWHGVPSDAQKTITEFAEWVVEHRQQIPQWFPIDHARDAFAATYPFHPLTISVFERKWQALPRFQRTRGVLRLLALWVSRAYKDGYEGAHRDPLIGLGTAPLDNMMFRTAVFEQLGESRLEGAVTTDICGKPDSHAVRQDKEAPEAIKKARLHRKVATTIFFESNGGQTKTAATLPEARLAVAGPDVDIGNVETVLETLSSNCYFLSVEGNQYRLSLTPNLNKLLADRRATIASPKIDERVRQEIQKVFAEGKEKEVERIYFPEKSNQIPDRPWLTFAILSPEYSAIDNKETFGIVESMTKEYGKSGRTFKNAVVWCVPETASGLRDEARKLLAWEAIQDEEDDLRLDETQKRHLLENVKKAQRDLKEAVWRTYKIVLLLAKDNTIRIVDLGLVHSSSGESMMKFIIEQLRKEGEIEPSLSANFVAKNWPAFKEWSTKAVRDAVFASPQFPRLLNPESIKDTIANGVSSGTFAYVGKTKSDVYDPFCFRTSPDPNEIEISDEMFIIRKEAAEAYKKAQETPASDTPVTLKGLPEPETKQSYEGSKETSASPRKLKRINWSGEVPWQKFSIFYSKVLSRFSGKSLRITVSVDVVDDDGISAQKLEETKTALRELNLRDDVKTEQQ